MMWIVSVAIHTLREEQRPLEVATGVTLHAIHARMFSEQRIFGLGMIEVLADRSHRNLLPAPGVMAGLAALRKASPVRVAMAIRALIEGDSDVARFVVGSGCVTFLAGYVRMQSGQRVSGLEVIELSDRHCLPVVVIVALQAIRTQASFVFVLVAGDTGRGNSQEGPVEVFELDIRALGR